MTADGRLPEFTNDRIVEAKLEKSWLRVGPLWTNPTGGSGSRRDRPPFGFIAGKRSVKFRFPEAAIHHRVLTTPSGSCRPDKADAQRRVDRTLLAVRSNAMLNSVFFPPFLRNCTIEGRKNGLSNFDTLERRKLRAESRFVRRESI